MSKRYFQKQVSFKDDMEIITLNSKDIESRVFAYNCFYVNKYDVDNLKEWKAGLIDDTANIEENFITGIDNFSKIEKIQDLILLWDGDLKHYNDVHDVKITQGDIDKVVEIMKRESFTRDSDTPEFYIDDDYNLIQLTGEGSNYIEVTEELESLKTIDKEINEYSMYLLKRNDDDIYLVEISFMGNVNHDIYYEIYDDDITTVEEALEYLGL